MGDTNTHIRNIRPSTETARGSQHTLVVGIDFGTYGSGFAYQYRTEFENNNKEIYAFKWPDSTYKTTTSLLLKPDGTFYSFGSDARKKFYTYCTDDVEDKPENWEDYLFFENFKMFLYFSDETLIGDDLPVEAQNLKTVPAIVVFTNVIECMKSKLLEKLNLRGNLKKWSKNDATPDHILWVITVPAIWGEPAKQLMCRAAVKAGISRENLALALEPECAAIYCSQISPELLDIHNADGEIERILQPDATIMVVDMGGGTVDIAVMMIKDDGKMEQVYKSGGNSYGGVRINNKILQELKLVFGEDVMRAFCQTYGLDEKELRDEIERAKREWNENETFAMKLPHNLEKVWKNHNAGKNLKAHLRKHNVIKEGGYLIIEKETFVHLLDECVKGIYDYLKKVMSDPSLNRHPVNALLVVGGFAESTYLVQHLRQRLADRRIPVIRPEDSELCVLKGSVLYGQNEKIMTSRIMMKTCGVAITTNFVRGRHIEREKYVDANGVEMANNVFSKHIEVGQSIPVQEWSHGIDYFPSTDDQTTTRVYIFQSDRENPEHTTEDGCTCIGYVEFDFPDLTEDKERKVNVDFYFAGTFIKVRAKTIGQTKILRISRDKNTKSSVK